MEGKVQVRGDDKKRGNVRGEGKNSNFQIIR